MNINVSDIVDGKPSIILGLIWTIILYFQVRKQHSENYMYTRCLHVEMYMYMYIVSSLSSWLICLFYKYMYVILIGTKI